MKQTLLALTSSSEMYMYVNVVPNDILFIALLFLQEVVLIASKNGDGAFLIPKYFSNN